MPWKKVHKALKKLEDRINRQKNAKKLEEYLIIFRIGHQHYYYRFQHKKSAGKPNVFSNNPKMEIIEIHKAKSWPEEKIAKRLECLNGMRQGK